VTQPAPQHQAAQYSAPIKTNTFALIGFIGAFMIPVVGIVFGVLAQRQIAQTGEAGQGFARWAFGLGLAGTIFQGLFFIVWLSFFFSALSHVPFPN
jgi:hypothetical protein